MTAKEATFTVYARGILYMSVCTDLSIDEATVRLNAEEPAGTTLGWSIADESFASGEANGSPCNEGRGDARHYLFSC